MATQTNTGLNSPNSLFVEARDKLFRAIEVGDACDEHGNMIREEYYTSDSPGRAYLENKDLVKDLYNASVPSSVRNRADSTQEDLSDVNDTHMDGAERFWSSIKPRAQLLTILLSLHSIRVDSRIWTDFIQIDDAARGSLADLDDSLLPLDKESIRLRLSSYDGRSFQQCPNLQEDFISRQLLVCCVKLEDRQQKDRSAYSDKGNHLPLIQKISIGSGSSGRVYRVKFASGHFPAHESEELAMKQFSGNVADTTYAREWQQSEKLRGNDLTHASVLTACAALKLEVGALLFFPLADFNLWQYMNMERPEGPKDYAEKLSWLYELSRVAGALSFLHKESIYHGDIKSENILVSQSSTRPLELQITDFGIMADGGQQNTSHVLARSTKETPARPNSLGDDCHNRAPPDSTPAGKDMWGFGTVLSEILAWFGLGKQSLDSFELKRAQGFDNDQYFKVCHRRRRFHKGETKWYEARESVFEWFHTFTAKPLDANTRDLHGGVWNILRSILVCDQAKRLDAETVRQKLLSVRPNGFVEPGTGGRPSITPSPSEPAASVYATLLQAHQRSEHGRRTSLVNDTEIEVLNKCLDYAIRDCNLAVVSVLLGRFEGGANIVHRAVEARNLEFLAQLLPRSVECQDMDQPNAWGDLPLLMAVNGPKDLSDATDSRFEMVNHLLRLGANVNISDEDGETPLHYASRSALHAIVTALLDANARVNEKDNGDVTPLHLCASVVSSDVDRQPAACLQGLLNHGADRKARDGAGKYPLNYALDGKRHLEAERWAVIKLLCTDTAEQYVFDVFNELDKHTKELCMTMWEECNKVPA